MEVHGFPSYPSPPQSKRCSDACDEMLTAIQQSRQCQVDSDCREYGSCVAINKNTDLDMLEDLYRKAGQACEVTLHATGEDACVAAKCEAGKCVGLEHP